MLKSHGYYQKLMLIIDFENLGMSRSGFPKVHPVPRSTLNMILYEKDAIFNWL